jgi:hypothetical protein
LFPNAVYQNPNRNADRTAQPGCWRLSTCVLKLLQGVHIVTGRSHSACDSIRFSQSSQTDSLSVHLPGVTPEALPVQKLWTRQTADSHPWLVNPATATPSRTSPGPPCVTLTLSNPAVKTGSRARSLSFAQMSPPQAVSSKQHFKEKEHENVSGK